MTEYLGQFFRNPAFWGIAALLILVPIIIHLINRLRFKRIRWAAMEFLLKAQKRNRRRLIIEQLLLLALRCLLVALLGVLVMRFVGVSFADMGIKPQLHIVLLDDSLSMNDQWKKLETDEKYTNCFLVAKNDILIDRIVPKLRQSSPNDRLIILPLSKAGDDKAPKIYDQLTENSRFDELKTDVANLQPTLLHLNLIDGIKRARKLAGDDPNTMVTLHVLSDFRQKDWAGEEGTPLHKELLDFTSQLKAKAFMVDASFPVRITNQGQAPPARDNIGIVDLKPHARVIGKDVPVTFTITLANFGTDADVNVDIYDHTTGKKRDEIDFTPILPLKLKKDQQMTATFEIRFSPELKPGQSHVAAISAHLRGTLTKDGLPQDNVAYGAVEVREQVPILIVDGEGKAGFEDKKGRDSFFLEEALNSVPTYGTREEGVRPLPPYRVDFGYELGNGVAMKALERNDLRKYPTIILANVPALSTKQQENLETYVQEGGGLCIFMGPLVSPAYYNEKLWRKGEGVFPVKLEEPYFPAPDKAKLDPEYIKTVPMLILHEELTPFPVFGPIMKDPKQREFFEHLPVFRYFKVAKRPDPRQVKELATLPNDREITKYQKQVMDIVRASDSRLSRLFDKAAFARFAGTFQPYRDTLEQLVEPTSQKRPYYLALVLEKMLKDKNKSGVDMPLFWSNVDLDVQSAKKDIEALLHQVRYTDGAPFVLASNFGKGKVITVMSTAGTLWNEWAGGSKATVLYQPFIWEIQNYLSAQSTDTNLTIGKPVSYTIDTEPFVKRKGKLMMIRSQLKLRKDNPMEKTSDKGQRGEEKENQQLTFNYPKTEEPGVYVAELVYDDDKDTVLAVRPAVFNLDTLREGALERVATDFIKNKIIDKSANDKGEKTVIFEGSGITQDALGPRVSDLSENPLFFLIILAILVAEQALAVHLSFHLKGNENQLNPSDVPQRTAA